MISCALPLLFGFFIPFIQLLLWAIRTFEDMVNLEFWWLILNSFYLAGLAAILTLILAVFLAYANRVQTNRLLAFFSRFCSMGYAIPGTVIAVGVLIPFGALDNAIDSWFRSTWNVSSGLLFSGTIFILLFAYCVRFLSVSLQSTEAGLTKIKPSVDEAAATLGHRPASILLGIHFPLIKGSLMTAVLLVFVDVLKELPATLILRPFNFNTLAVRAYELASDERLADSASAAVAIVLVGILPVILLSRSIARSRPGNQSNAP